MKKFLTLAAGLMERNGIGYGDIYMATALSKISAKPVGAVAEDFHKNPGRVWDVQAEGQRDERSNLKRRRT